MNSFTLNVVQLGIGFFLIFFAFFSESFIQESVVDHYAGRTDLVHKHDGYTSLAIIYGAFVISAWIAAPIVSWLNARWALAFAAVTYVLFQMGFLFINRTYLFVSSVFVGLGAAVIWTAQGKYISLNSTEQTASKHVSIFWVTSQSCFALGGVFLFFVFQYWDSFEENTVRTIYGVFTAFSLIGAIILAFLRLPTCPPGQTQEDGSVIPKDIPLTHAQMFYSTLKLATSKRMLVLAVCLAYTGLQLSFWSGIYPTCISFTQKLGSNTKGLIALNLIAQGVAEAIAAVVCICLNNSTRFKVSRVNIICFGTLSHVVAYCIIGLSFPALAPLYETDGSGMFEPRTEIALFCGFLLGLGDACWNMQMFAFLISKYPLRAEQAFSLYMFFQALAASVSFFYSKFLELHWHSLILIAAVLLACICFSIAERIRDEDEEAEDGVKSAEYDKLAIS
ncbi:ion channel regulatory protein UNC-93 domain-containing protein [Ditylenchus destructor]|uniref:UNC93-like protein MFSD11 n=1 Tax=Ditylenchus destructor TaxID=166010 RepID=A0AAD4MFL2_9BILA|nr:ion channel regulatory protein UNC-93 domain-containing protein [Ditylenchus destructor]